MSCQICKRGACARWMHSLEEQERFDERETMSDDVDELRRTVQELRDEIRDLVAENITLRESPTKKVSDSPPLASHNTKTANGEFAAPLG